MVSIHKVPVIVHLIIRVISSTFRFKRGTFSVFPFRGVWRNLINRITKSPRHRREHFCHILVDFF